MNIIRLAYVTHQDENSLQAQSELVDLDSLSQASQQAVELVLDFKDAVRGGPMTLPRVLEVGALVLVKSGAEYVVEQVTGYKEFTKATVYDIIGDDTLSTLEYIGRGSPYSWFGYYEYLPPPVYNVYTASYEDEIVYDVPCCDTLCTYSGSVGSLSDFTVFVNTIYTSGSNSGERHCFMPLWAVPHHLHYEESPPDLSAWLQYNQENMWNNLDPDCYQGGHFRYCSQFGPSRHSSSYFTSTYSRSVMYCRAYIVSREWVATGPVIPPVGGYGGVIPYIASWPYLPPFLEKIGFSGRRGGAGGIISISGHPVSIGHDFIGFGEE